MVEEVTPEELRAKLADGEDVQVVDIRPEPQFREGHIPGAVNVPFYEFARAVENREWSDRVVVACPKGESSLQACRLLESYEGVDDDAWVANLAGGYREWDADLERGDGDGSDGD